jgi:hypothetical protein
MTTWIFIPKGPVKMKTSHLEMIAAHLNAPYGDVVMADDVAAVLRTGTLASIPPGLPRSVLFSLFSECAPATILSAAIGAGGSWRTAQALYKEIVASGGTRVSAWEGAA